MSRIGPRALARLCVALVLGAGAAAAQTPPSAMTAEQDHQQMMDQLGIRTLRPGVDSDPKARVRPVNYDEAKANPYPVWPDPLTYADGRKVATAAEWWGKRRPELIELFEREIYGRVPASAPEVTWTVQTLDHEALGFTIISGMSTLIPGALALSTWPITRVATIGVKPRDSWSTVCTAQVTLGAVSGTRP